MTASTIIISTEDMGVINSLRAGLESRDMIDLFGLTFTGVKLETYSNSGRPSAVMIAQHVVAAQPEPAPQWSGEGRPPIGTMCEYRVGDGTWFACTVRYVTAPPQASRPR